MSVTVEEASAELMASPQRDVAAAPEPRGLSEEDVRAMLRRDRQRRDRLTVD